MASPKAVLFSRDVHSALRQHGLVRLRHSEAKRLGSSSWAYNRSTIHLAEYNVVFGSFVYRHPSPHKSPRPERKIPLHARWQTCTSNLHYVVKAYEDSYINKEQRSAAIKICPRSADRARSSLRKPQSQTSLQSISHNSDNKKTPAEREENLANSTSHQKDHRCWHSHWFPEVCILQPQPPIQPVGLWTSV